MKELLLENCDFSVPDAVACSKPRADTGPGMGFNTTYFCRLCVDTYGQQNSNQLGTLGLNIPVFWGCFLTPSASRGVLSFQPCQKRQYIKRPRTGSLEHLFQAIFNSVKSRPFIFCSVKLKFCEARHLYDLVANCSSKLTSKSMILGQTDLHKVPLPIENHMDPVKWKEIWKEPLHAFQKRKLIVFLFCLSFCLSVFLSVIVLIPLIYSVHYLCKCKQ